MAGADRLRTEAAMRAGLDDDLGLQRTDERGDQFEDFHLSRHAVVRVPVVRTRTVGRWGGQLRLEHGAP